MRWLVAFLAFICMCAPAHADVSMTDRLCTQSSAKTVSVTTMISAAGSFDCSESKYDVSGPRVWVKIPFVADTLPPGEIEVQGDNNGLTTMAVHALLDDGTILSKDFSKQAVIDHWRPKGYYGLPVPGTDDPAIRERIQHVYLAIDDPKVVSSISLVQFALKQKWDDLEMPLLVMFALLCGMAMMPLIYHIFFYGALRYSFMIYHSVMIAATLVYTFSSSGLMFLAFPETTLITKMLLNYWTLAIGVAASGFFLVRFVGPGKIAPWLKVLIYLTVLLPVVVTATVLRIDEGYSMDARNYYHASFIPGFFVILFTMGFALRRGSTAIWFQIAGWTPIVLFGLDRVARGMDLYIGWPALDYGLYFALVLETVVLALGVAHRIFRLRQQHENTLDKQAELTLLAETDGLTKMSNRRAFEQEFRRNQHDKVYSHLAIFDIDFFKRVNDRYGHEIGDSVLRIVGGQLDRTSHFAARIGGEEFTLLLRSEGLAQDEKYLANALTEICENLIKTVHDQVPIIREPVTFSVGVAAISGRSSLRSVMAIADRRLYNAKKNGRNQIVWVDVSENNSGMPPGMAQA